MSSNQSTPPDSAGFMTNAKGHMVPVSLVSAIDKQRDEIVREIAAKAIEQSAALARFKAGVIGDMQAFIELSGERYGVKMGGAKGNVTLHSFDGRYKVQRAIQESITFDERLQVAKELVDQCITLWAKGANDKIRALVNDAFQVDTEGRISTGRILSLRRLEIKDEKWEQAMKAIADAIQVVGSKAYIRVYERVGDTEQYRPINLDLAAV